MLLNADSDLLSTNAVTAFRELSVLFRLLGRFTLQPCRLSTAAPQADLPTFHALIRVLRLTIADHSSRFPCYDPSVATLLHAVNLVPVVCPRRVAVIEILVVNVWEVSAGQSACEGTHDPCFELFGVSRY